MTLYFVKYLIELQKRQGKLLIEGRDHILRSFERKINLIGDQGSRLFSMKNEIQLFDNLTTKSLTEQLQAFFLGNDQAVSPFVNPDAFSDKVLKKAVMESSSLALLIRKMVMIASMEILDANAQVKPEVIELLNLSESCDHPRLPGVLIEQYVMAMRKHILSEWFKIPEYQEQVRTCVFKQQSASMLLANLKSRLEGAIRLKNATAVHHELHTLVTNYKDKLVNFNFNTNDEVLTAQLKELAASIVGTRKILVPELNKYIQIDYQKMKEDLIERNAQLYPTLYMMLVVRASLPDLVKEARQKIVEFGMPLAIDFNSGNFIEFLKKRVTATNIPVTAILNDDPILFDDNQIFSNGKGPTFRQLESSFNDLLLQNFEINNFIKQWVHLSFAQILEVKGDKEGQFNEQAINTIESTQPWVGRAIEAIDDEEVNDEEKNDEAKNNEKYLWENKGHIAGSFIHAQIRDKRYIDQIRTPLIIEAMTAVLVAILIKYTKDINSDVRTVLLDDLSEALNNPMPGSITEILELDLLHKQNAIGNLRSCLRTIFKTFNFKDIKVEVEKKIKASSKLETEAEAAKKEKPLIVTALNVLIERRSDALKKNQSTTVESFIKDFTLIVSQQLLDQNGYQRIPIDNNSGGSLVVMNSIQHVLTTLIADNAVTKAVVLHNMPSVNLQKLLHQISNGLILYSNVAVAELDKTLVFKTKDPRAHLAQAFPYYTPETPNKRKIAKPLRESKDVAPKEIKDKRVLFQQMLSHCMQVVDTDNLMIRVAEKIAADITPFTREAVVQLTQDFDQIMLQYLRESDIQEQAIFKKFIITMSLLAYAEVLDENGDVKIDSTYLENSEEPTARAFADDLRDVAQHNRKPLIAVFLRKLLITISVRWVAQGKFETLLNEGMTAKALDAVLDSIEHALSAGVSTEVLSSLPTFPLFNREDNITKFIIPLEISPVKNQNPVLSLALEALSISNSLGLTLLLSSVLLEKKVSHTNAVIEELNDQDEQTESKEAAHAKLSTDDLIASIQALVPKPVENDNTDLLNFYAEQIPTDEQVNSGIQEVQDLLAEFKQLVGPQPKPATTVKEVIKIAITKQLALTKMSDDFQNFNDKYKSSFENINTLQIRAERILQIAEAIYKEVHKDFSGSTAFVRKLRDQYKSLSDLIEDSNFQLMATGVLIKNLMKNGFLLSMQAFMETVNQITSKQQHIIIQFSQVDNAYTELQALAADWNNSKERLHAFRNICNETIPFLDRMESEIAEKRANVAQNRQLYLERRAIHTAMLSEGSTFDDLQNNVEAMETSYAALSANIAALRKRCKDLFEAPIEQLQNSDDGDFRVEIMQAKNKLLTERQQLFVLGNETLAIATQHTAKKDQTQDVRDSIFLKLNMILTESPEFWERRLSFFGGGVAFVDNEGATRKGPTRAVAMMKAAKALPFEQESDLKLRAILDAFENTKGSLLGLGQSKKTAKFYAIIQSLITLSKTDFYNLAELQNIDGQISAFMQGYSTRYAFEARFERFSQQAHYRVLGSQFVPGESKPTSASMSYANLATNPSLPAGMLHLFDVRRKGQFVPSEIELPRLAVEEEKEEKCDPPKPSNGSR
jgi:hypothetical protein